MQSFLQEKLIFSDYVLEYTYFCYSYTMAQKAISMCLYILQTIYIFIYA